MAAVGGGFQLRVEWRSRLATHVDTLHVATVPMATEAAARALMLSEAGFRPLAAESLPVRDPARCLPVDAGHVDADTGTWRHGRFHAVGALPAPWRDAIGAGRRAVRCSVADDGAVTLDANHPLAGVEVALSARGLDDSAPDAARLGAALARLLEGPGMQAPLGGRATDFSDDDAWRRDDEGDDRRFYGPPRLVTHLDAATLHVLATMYGRLLPRAADLLDLMASWASHLAPALVPQRVVGLGLNATELAANPVLGGAVIADLNRRPALPFARHAFAAAVCSLSVDYLTHPREVFAEVARVLAPGGVFAVAFSDRCFPTKVVRLWRRLSDFERLGLVLQQLADAGFESLNSWTLRGLPRPATGGRADRSLVADPLFLAWGRTPVGPA